MIRMMEDKKVVVVAGDRTRRAADAMQLQPGQVAHMVGEEIGLHLLGNGELALQALLLLLLGEQSFERSGHTIERTIQLAQLVLLPPVCCRNTMYEVAAVDPLSGRVKLFDRFCEVAAEAQRHPQGKRLNQREEHAQRNQAVADSTGNDPAERTAEELPVEQRGTRVHLDDRGQRGSLAGLPVDGVQGRGEAHAKVVDID